jgi:predicted DNA-binding ribbon-helix-helix protein
MDSIEELAEFWDTHDLTDFESELEEVSEPVCVRGAAIRISLEGEEARSLRQLAAAQGLSTAELVREWIREKLPRRRTNHPKKRSS